MNEPEWTSEGAALTPEMKKVRDAFLESFYNHIKQKFPDEIVSVGWARLENAEEYSGLADVITFHVYGGPERIQSYIDKAQAVEKSSGKTTLITETLANWDFGSPDFGSLATDEQQLDHYQKVLPTLIKSPVGWIGWGLVISEDFDPYTDIMASLVRRRVTSKKCLQGTNPSPRSRTTWSQPWSWAILWCSILNIWGRRLTGQRREAA